MVLHVSSGSAFSAVDEGWLVAKFSAETASGQRAGDIDGSPAAKRRRSVPVSSFVQESIEQADRDANELRSRVRTQKRGPARTGAPGLSPVVSLPTQAVRAALRITTGAVAEAKQLRQEAKSAAAEQQARLELASEALRQRMLREAQAEAAEIRRKAEVQARETREKAEKEESAGAKKQSSWKGYKAWLKEREGG